MDTDYDVAIVGGGAAGLSAALMLGRSRRSVVVVDAGEPRNEPAAHMHGFITRDGTPPAELLELARAEVQGYGVELRHGSVDGAAVIDGGFALTLAGGTGITARQLLVTTGLVDELPDVPGVRELWGDQVIHCPYCHGWEARDQRIGVLASGAMATHQALLFRQLSDDVVLFAHTHPPTDEQRADLAARDIPVVDEEVVALEVVDGRLTGVRLATGETIARDVVSVAPRFVARATFLEALGVQLEELPMGVGVRVATDPQGRTNVPGVWAAGNVSDHSAQVIVAAGQGAVAGAQINAALVVDEVAKGRQIPA